MRALPTPRTPGEAAVRLAQQILARRMARERLDAVAARVEAARPAPYLAPCIGDLAGL